MGSSPTKGASVRAQKYVQSDNGEDNTEQSSKQITNGRIPVHLGRPKSAPIAAKDEDYFDSEFNSGRNSSVSCYRKSQSDAQRKVHKGRQYVVTEDKTDDITDNECNPSFQDLAISDKLDKNNTAAGLRSFQYGQVKSTQ